MFLSSSPLEQQIQKNAQAIDALAIKIEALNRDVDDLLKELNVTPQQLTAFLTNKEHFTEENWETITQERKKLDELLLRDLVNVSDPMKRKKAYSERRVQPHWLFVR